MIQPRALLAFMLLVQIPLRANGDGTPPLESVGPNLARLSGLEARSGISYVRFLLLEDVSEVTPVRPGTSFDLARPTLTAQCTKDPRGKLRFELFLNFGNVTDTAFYPPWRPTAPGDFPPRTEKVTVTMEFLGYTHFKPAKRQFEKVPAPYGQLRYNNPGIGSSNMEDLSYYLQVLRALPTLRVTSGTRTASFSTTALLTRLHAEPFCQSAGV